MRIVRKRRIVKKNEKKILNRAKVGLILFAERDVLKLSSSHIPNLKVGKGG